MTIIKATEAPVFPADLMALLGITSTGTLRQYIRARKVPPPDVQISQKQRYWHRETLVKAGLIEKKEG